MKHYILDGKKVVPCNDVLDWAKAFEKQDRIVVRDSIGDVDISTVFLGLDHNWGEGLPLLFETMVFGGDLDQEMDRYSTWEEAEIGHQEMIKKVKNLNPTKSDKR